ncbi:TonB family protein [Luteimonas sp. 50]|uniref:TonB family protein n=1 Tax=Cognatiluteimonas sedimenti TaxID=2927791 RepID=A0ABT0A4W5_9GAMM|nr:energy transducer TonB [Lysobacter sedimenti]MCJ0826019.1 TonB family protein [Lysobacter sedimenti]
MVHAIQVPSRSSLSHSASPRPWPPRHPDVNRIAGYAVAITFNAAMLLLLLVPLRAPPALEQPDITQPIRWILRETPPPQPPLPATIEKPRPQPPSTTAPRTVETQPQPPVFSEQGELAPEVPDAPDVPVAPTIQVPAAPMPGVRLEYAQAPAPTYPRAALRAGAEGTVLLQVLVDIDGRPLQVDVSRSSGDRRLDVAARDQVLRHWRFRPALRDGQAVQAIGLVPIDFSLDR